VSILLQPVATAFRVGVAIRAASYRYGWLKTRRLSRPVVSVGNLTLGGTGKTPLVAYIAETLLRRGRLPGILTRGYGRRGRDDLIAIEPRACRNPDPREIGDEPALLARALPQVPVVVCADRYRGGRMLEKRFGVDVHLLDDGFQHWVLARDVDIVTLDLTQKLSNAALLPAGRQREPCSALARAHLIVLTRRELGDQPALESLENQVRRFNSLAKIFLSTTVLCGLRNADGSGIEPPQGFRGPERRPVAAFCGIGNPNAFFADLRQWGFGIACEKSYRDHHVYSPRDLEFLQQLAVRCGARALVTTEKDALNLPRAGEGVPIFACVIRSELSEAEAFEEALLLRLRSQTE
jgi:tetraacyldisaccharide 4'-kinase